MRHHRQAEPPVPHHERVEQGRPAQLQLPRHLRGRRTSSTRADRGGADHAHARRQDATGPRCPGPIRGHGLDGASTGQLGSALLARTAFIHHRTGTTVHGDQPKVMKLLGDTSGGEMLVSAYAKHLSTCFGTVQAAPIAVGRARQLQRAGQLRGPDAAVDLADAAQAAAHRRARRRAPLRWALRDLRDTSLNQLNAMAKPTPARCRRQFLDKLALGQTQVRRSPTARRHAERDQHDNVAGSGAGGGGADRRQRHAGRDRCTSRFGGDNHTDSNLQAEADQHVSGIQGIQQIMTALANMKDSAASR